MKKIVFAGLLVLLSACASKVPEHVTLQSMQVSDLGDVDSDGVVNARDVCLASSEGATLNNSGCGKWQSTPSRKIYSVNFDLNSAVIRDDQRETIAMAIKEVQRSDDATVVLVGDTSAEGSDELNQALGKRRADAIAEVLRASGLPEQRMEGYVYHESHVRARMDRRERRTIILVKRPTSPKSVNDWTVYQAEEQQELSKVQEGANK